MACKNRRKPKIAVKSPISRHDAMNIAREASAAPAASFKSPNRKLGYALVSLFRRRNFQKGGYWTEWTEKDEKHHMFISSKFGSHTLISYHCRTMKWEKLFGTRPMRLPAYFEMRPSFFIFY